LKIKTIVQLAVCDRDCLVAVTDRLLNGHILFEYYFGKSSFFIKS